MVDLDLIQDQEFSGFQKFKIILSSDRLWRVAGYEFYPEIRPTVKLICKKGLYIVLGMWVKQVVGLGI